MRDTLHNLYGCDSIYNVATITILTKPAAPAAITGPATVTAGQANIQFTVSPISGLTYYWVSNQGSITAGQGTNTVLVTWGNVAGSISVYAVNRCDTSAASNKKVTIVAGALANSQGVQRAVGGMAKSAKVYPNPAVSTATLQLDGLKGTAGITITDMAGKKHYQRSGVIGKTCVLPVGGLPAGLYMVTVKDAETVITLKVTVAK